MEFFSRSAGENDSTQTIHFSWVYANTSLCSVFATTLFFFLILKLQPSDVNAFSVRYSLS